MSDFAMSTLRAQAGPTALVLGLCAALWVALWIWAGQEALISEDWFHLGVATGQSGWGEAFDLARVPMRPLQHVVFYGLAQLDEPSPGLARAVGLAGHLVAILALHALARAWTGSARASLLATVLFALAPNVVSVFSPAALGWPWRVAFSLLALVAFERYAKERSWLAGVAAIGAWVIALGFHQGAFIVPGFAFLRALVLAQGEARKRMLFSPGLILWCSLALGYVAYLQFVRPATGHGLKPWDSVPANVVRASLSMFPEPLRIYAVAGFRAGTGEGYAIGGAIMMLPALFAGFVLLRGSRLARLVLLAIGLEFFVPVLTTGFAARYAYLAFAFAATAIGAAASLRGGVFLALFAVVGLAWGADCAYDAVEFREATKSATELIDTALDQRRESPDQPIAIVDVPERWGNELEMQYFGIGLRRALELSGGQGPWLILRTWQNFHTTDVHPMAPEEIARREARGELVVLRWDAKQLKLVGAQ